MTYQSHLMQDRYAKAALATRLVQPALKQCAIYLLIQDLNRMKDRGKQLSDDHLKQLAIKWEREHGPH